MELNQYTDQQIAERMVRYIERLEALMEEVNRYVQGEKGACRSEVIHDEYRKLKKEMGDDAHYLGLNRNERHDASILYKKFFKPSIMEANAYGFASPTNGRIDQRFYSAIINARRRLIKQFSLKKWRATANGEPPPFN